jgi:hypothetical protein
MLYNQLGLQSVIHFVSDPPLGFSVRLLAPSLHVPVGPVVRLPKTIRSWEELAELPAEELKEFWKLLILAPANGEWYQAFELAPEFRPFDLP